MPPEIKITKETKNVFTPDYGVPLIMLGDGGTLIAETFDGCGSSGVAFLEVGNDLGVGVDQDIEGGTVEKAVAYFHIMSTSPESLTVLIDKLIIARDILQSTSDNL